MINSLHVGMYWGGENDDSETSDIPSSDFDICVISDAG